MSNIAYLLDRSKSWEGRMQPLPKDFVARFLTAAKSNRTLELGIDPEYPDQAFMRGFDWCGRRLVGTWSRTRELAQAGRVLVMFRNTADDQF